MLACDKALLNALYKRRLETFMKRFLDINLNGAFLLFATSVGNRGGPRHVRMEAESEIFVVCVLFFCSLAYTVSGFRNVEIQFADVGSLVYLFFFFVSAIAIEGGNIFKTIPYILINILICMLVPWCVNVLQCFKVSVYCT